MFCQHSAGRNRPSVMTFLWATSSHHEICEGCSLLPLGASRVYRRGSYTQVGNPKSVLLDLEFSSFAGEISER